MSIKLVFFDLDTKIVDSYRKLLNGLSSKIFEIVVIEENVRKLKDIDVFVSPANSYGYMDGGIDLVYMRMFKEIQKRVMKEIADRGQRLGFTVGAGRYRLPIGSAILTNVGDDPKQKQQLICAPTMERPRDIRNSPQNVYYAMIAILNICEKLPRNSVVAIPGLGTGCGHLSGSVSGAEIARALVDFNLANQSPYNKLTQIQYPDPVQVIENNSRAYMVLPAFLQ